MIRKTNQTVLTWKRFLKSLPKENTNCISFIKIIMPDEFAFALQPVLVLGRGEPGKTPAEKAENEKETDSVKAMADEKEVNYYKDQIIWDIVNVFNKDPTDSSEETVGPNQTVVVIEMTEGEGIDDLVSIEKV